MSRFRPNYMQKGFSLVELLIVVTISLIVGGAILQAMMSQTQLTATQNRNIINRENLRDALRFMSDEIQLMGNGASEPFILTALESEFDYIGDVNGDGSLDRVLYTVNNGTVSRTLHSTNDGGATWAVVSTDTIVDGANGLSFTYFAIGDTVPATVDDITSVDIEIQLDPNRNATSFTAGKVASKGMAIRVTLRNRL